MGLGDLLKKAFGAVGEFDRKVVYGPDYKARAESLGQLNDLTIKAKLLENQDKFERIRLLRQEMADRERQQQSGAFKEAVTLGSNLAPTPIPGYVNPDKPDASIDAIDPNNILHKPGEGMVEPELPSFIKSQLRPEDEGTLAAAIREGRRLKTRKERNEDQIFQANLGYQNLRDDVEQARIRSLNANADRADRTPIGGGPRSPVDSTVNVTWTDENGVLHSQWMPKSKAAQLGELTSTTSGERKEIKSAVSDLAMAKSLEDNFKPEYTDRLNNTVQAFRENVPDLGLGLVDEADPDFAEWRANNRRLNNAIIKELSGAQVTPSEYPRITGQLAMLEVNATTWLARNRAQQKALEVAIGIKTGKMGVEDGRRVLSALEKELAKIEGGGGPRTSRPTAPNSPAPPVGWEFDAEGVLQPKVKQ